MARAFRNSLSMAKQQAASSVSYDLVCVAYNRAVRGGGTDLESHKLHIRHPYLATTRPPIPSSSHIPRNTSCTGRNVRFRAIPWSPVDEVSLWISFERRTTTRSRTRMPVPVPLRPMRTTPVSTSSPMPHLPSPPTCPYRTPHTQTPGLALTKRLIPYPPPPSVQPCPPFEPVHVLRPHPQQPVLLL